MTPAQLHDALANGLTAQQIEDQSAEDDEFERMERESQPAALEASTADSVHQINMRRATNRFEQLMIENKNLRRNLTFWRDSYSLLSRTAHAAERGIERADDEFIRMSGEAAVLRDLLAESLSVIKTIDGADECECDLLESLCDKIKAAIVPKLSHGQQAANEKQLSVDVDLMARGKKMHFVYPPDAQGDDS
jgi:hypothetical protein